MVDVTLQLNQLNFKLQGKGIITFSILEQVILLKENYHFLFKTLIEKLSNFTEALPRKQYGT